MIFFEEIHLFYQLRVILFGAKRAYVHLAIAKMQEVFFSDTNKILTGKQCATWCCF
jgi:hypothetical protein